MQRHDISKYLKTVERSLSYSALENVNIPVRPNYANMLSLKC